MESMKQAPYTTSQLTATVPPPQNSAAAAKPQPQPNKRKLSADFHNSAYFKIRALACQLRPHFIEVLKTPDFRNCKAAHEIRMQMKLMVEFYKQMIVEKDQLETFVSEQHRPSAGENLLGRHISGGHQEGNKPKPLQHKHSLEASQKEKPETTIPFGSKKKVDNVSQDRESYVVGGSVFGWNFITYLGSKPVYYGVTKKSFRRGSHGK